MNWLWGSVVKMLAHPALLPIALATFISVAGPGGFAEIGRHVAAVPTVTITPETLPTVPNPPAFLVRQVNDEPPAVPSPPVEHVVPSELENSDEPLFVSLDGAVATHDAAPTEIEVPEATTQPDTPGTPPEVEDPEAVPATPEEPVDDPVDGGAGNDDGNAGDGEEPPDDGEPGSDSPVGDGEDNGEGDPADGGDGDGGDEVQCDPPGNGPDPYDGVPPGHDQNGDGIDDRCQDDESGGQDPGGDGNDTGDTGTGDTGTGDTGTGDTGTGDTGTGDNGTGESGTGDSGANDEDVPTPSGADVTECDTPGNGHDNHGTPPPGHDKNEDGIDDRCQAAIVRALVRTIMKIPAGPDFR